MSSMSDYRRQLAEYALRRQSSPATAAEIAEAMVCLASNESHPRAAWRSITAAAVVHLLRAAEKDGHAERSGERKNATNGRMEPTWLATSRAAKTMPPAPDVEDDGEDPPAPPAAPPLALTPPEPPEASPFDDMTRDELVAIATAQDAALQAWTELNRVSAEIRTKAMARVRDRLSKAGLMP